MLGSKQHPFVRKGYIAKTRVNSVFILTKVMITEQVTWKERLLASEKTPILQFLVPRHALHTCPRSPCSPASRAVRHSSHCIPTAPVLVPYERAGVSAVNLRDSNRTFFPVKKQQRASSLSKMIIELPMFTFSRAGGGKILLCFHLFDIQAFQDVRLFSYARYCCCSCRTSCRLSFFVVKCVRMLSAAIRVLSVNP